ncbi:hypothetical protein AVEN_237223-1 [Araneus ventricosus]|uniref:CCHC-type domain-containing protein n=1 Tax=Araneus ventricosus TaxID=182803 RepID=A0A4Y2M761_ARAVE|nr:hypothetical protein AVEN_237223-1 [Araneus ventricosus]
MLLSNLTPEIRRGVIAANPKSIDEIKEAALLQKRAWDVCYNGRNPFAPQQAHNFTTERKADEKNSDELNKKLVEKVESLTVTVEKLVKQNERGVQRNNLCFSCNTPGHVDRFCPDRERQRTRYQPRYNNRSSDRQEYSNEGSNYNQERQVNSRHLN